MILGFQHYLLTLGITVLIPTIIVPQMGGGDVRKKLLIHLLKNFCDVVIEQKCFDSM